MLRLIIAVFGFLAVFTVAGSVRAADDKPAEPVQLNYSAWTKSCTRDVDVNGRQICFATKTGRIESGQMVVAAILVQRDGESWKTLRVVLPIGMQIVRGTRVIVDSATPEQKPFSFCTADGCVSDYDLTPELMAQLRKGQTLTVQAFNANAAPLSLSLPLADFGQAFNGGATDWNAVEDKQKKMLTSLFRIRDESGQAEASPALIFSPWTKFCLKGQDANAKQVCFTGKDGRVESGQPAIAAVVIEPQDGSKKLLRVTLTLGMQLTSGTRLTIDGNSPVYSPYVICFANGCMSDYEVTPALLANLRNGRSLTIRGVENTGRAISRELPLDTFVKAYDGPPTDPKAFEVQQKKLQEELNQRAAARQNQNGPNNPVIAAVKPPEPIAPAAAPSKAAAIPFGRRVALVIGNSAYRNVPSLPNPQRDAATVADALRRAGFQSVTLQTDLEREQLVNALRGFAKVAEDADWAVVYYAGHGMEVAGVNYLIPIDAKILSDRDISLEAVPIDQVLNSAERAKQLRLVLLDACRDNPFASQMKRTMTMASRSVSRGLARIEPDPGTLVVYAAKHGETALDGDSNSPFATAFVRNLQTPGLEVRRLFDNVRDDVMDMTGRRQQPYSYGSVSGREDYYFTAAR